MAALPNPLSLPEAARNRIWAKLQLEYEERILFGKVVTGSSTGESFSTQVLTWPEFQALFVSWSNVMVGAVTDSGGQRVRPNFSFRG